jgi:hypothetical protein
VALALDLGPSEAKLARAREHAETLEAETTEGVEQEATHAVRFSPVDPETGWCEITMIPQEIDKPRLPVLLGDVIHNLRCALDYLIPPLVEASEAKLSTKHEFPIFLSRGNYAARVGTKTTANVKGPLRHIIHGLALIEQWQPYNGQGNPEGDPLWGVYRFSNADKHRQLAPFGLVPVGKFEIAYNGIVVEKEFLDEVDDWKPDDEIPVGRIRFDPPRAYDLRAVGRVNVDVRFIAPRFGKEDQLSLKLSAVPVVVECVAAVVDTFRHL